MGENQGIHVETFRMGQGQGRGHGFLKQGNLLAARALADHVQLALVQQHQTPRSGGDFFHQAAEGSFLQLKDIFHAAEFQGQQGLGRWRGRADADRGQQGNLRQQGRHAGRRKTGRCRIGRRKGHNGPGGGLAGHFQPETAQRVPPVPFLLLHREAVILPGQGQSGLDHGASAGGNGLIGSGNGLIRYAGRIQPLGPGGRGGHVQRLVKLCCHGTSQRALHTKNSLHAGAAAPTHAAAGAGDTARPGSITAADRSR